jgi:hypothetical protein
VAELGRGWSGLANTESSGWPADLAVTLHYNGREAITLPLRTEHYQGIRKAMLYEFLPALLRDVSTP